MDLFGKLTPEEKMTFLELMEKSLGVLNDFKL
jgi:hypothetical protein